jgi:hypothetical protein
MLNEGKSLARSPSRESLLEIPWAQHGAWTLRGPFRTINLLQELCDQAPHALDGRFVRERFRAADLLTTALTIWHVVPREKLRSQNGGMTVIHGSVFP